MPPQRSTPRLRIHPLGDAALLAELGTRLDTAVNTYAEDFGYDLDEEGHPLEEGAAPEPRRGSQSSSDSDSDRNADSDSEGGE